MEQTYNNIMKHFYIAHNTSAKLHVSIYVLYITEYKRNGIVHWVHNYYILQHVRSVK